MVAPPEFMRGRAPDLRRARDRARRRRGADRLRPHRQLFAIEHYDVEPDLITVAKSIAAGPAALGRDRQGGDHGRAAATRRSAAPTSATRSRRPPRSPCSTCSRRRAWSSARPRSARRSARACSPGRSAATRSATCAASARCSRSSSSATARRRSRRPSSRRAVVEAAAERGLLLLKSGHLLELHPRARPARDHRRRARRGAGRLGAGARRRARLSARRSRAQLSGVVGELIAERYELEELVGTGGMSSVYRAHDRLLERDVALKILHEQFTRRRRSTSSASAARRARSPSSRTRTSSR